MTDAQCDEHKPICNRCAKGSRDCSYPEPEERSRPTRNSESNSESKGVDEEKALTKSSSYSTSSIAFQLNHQRLIDSLISPSDFSEKQFGLPDPIVNFSISGHGYCRELLETQMIPNSQLDVMKFFLNYHRKYVTDYHYFCYHDYQKFFTTDLVVMAEQSEVLSIGLVAFSALIYSMNQRTARDRAFWYYTLALRQLRKLLNVAMDVSEYHLAITAALQLATFDVYPPQTC